MDTAVDNAGDQCQPTELGHYHYNWMDITEDFTTACTDLKLGELMHDANFGLFEAMSAIEMMDPKMDAGMMCNQRHSRVTSLQQGIEMGLVKVKGLTGQEMTGIIDDTLACLVTWLEGHSLAQTVFTNLYLHDPSLLEDCHIKAYSLCMLKIVESVRDIVNRAAVFEEEDFQPMMYGFKTVPELTSTRVCGMMKEVEDELNRVIKNTRSTSGQEDNADRQDMHKMALAEYSRIKFSRLFLVTLQAFCREKFVVADVQKYLGQLSELLPTMRETISLGTQPELTEESNCDYPTIMGFEPLLNQRLLPPTFPRYTKIRGRDDTLAYLEGLVSRLQTVCAVTELSGLHATLDFFLEFSKSSPCVLSRSLLQLVYLPQNRRVFGSPMIQVDVLKDTLRSFISPPALMAKSAIGNNPQAKEYVDAFLAHAVRPITAIFQITGHNRARQRDKWGHLLEELATLQDEADKVDAFLHTLLVKVEPNREHLACFGTWVLYHTLRVMVHYTLAGFELELYAVHEYHYVFWYLYECLYSWLISALSRADSFMLEQDAITEQQQKNRNGKKSRRKKKTRVHSREVALAQGAQSLCGGYYKAVTGITLDGKLKQPRFNFDSEEVRYNHRFAPFGCLVTPPAVQYAQFKEATDLTQYDPPVQPEDLYAGACKCFQQARVFYEKIASPDDQVQTLLKITKTNFVVMKLLMGGHMKEAKVRVHRSSQHYCPT
ncbi:hypothetical protein NP493_1045g00034 [Ridgeia piscesae]|uniref:Protein MAK10 homolog n=1 Tax=Ridgeia piscesae TaxID=27915 RepID=A0AAD9KI59_RIDPI|nr:hypothetical protein NP493_1045g00034 [Ridgeia piscesae]